MVTPWDNSRAGAAPASQRAHQGEITFPGRGSRARPFWSQMGCGAPSPPRPEPGEGARPPPDSARPRPAGLGAEGGLRLSHASETAFAPTPGRLCDSERLSQCLREQDRAFPSTCPVHRSDLSLGPGRAMGTQTTMEKHKWRRRCLKVTLFMPHLKDQMWLCSESHSHPSPR